MDEYIFVFMCYVHLNTNSLTASVTIHSQLRFIEPREIYTHVVTGIQIFDALCNIVLYQTIKFVDYEQQTLFMKHLNCANNKWHTISIPTVVLM